MMYWVGQKVHSGFSIILSSGERKNTILRKTQNELLANSVLKVVKVSLSEAVKRDKSTTVNLHTLGTKSLLSKMNENF